MGWKLIRTAVLCLHLVACAVICEAQTSMLDDRDKEAVRQIWADVLDNAPYEDRSRLRQTTLRIEPNTGIMHAYAIVGGQSEIQLGEAFLASIMLAQEAFAINVMGMTDGAWVESYIRYLAHSYQFETLIEPNIAAGLTDAQRDRLMSEEGAAYWLGGYALSVGFVIAHEMAHVALDHSTPVSPEQSVRREAAADAWALDVTVRAGMYPLAIVPYLLFMSELEASNDKGVRHHPHPIARSIKVVDRLPQIAERHPEVFAQLGMTDPVGTTSRIRDILKSRLEDLQSRSGYTKEDWLELARKGDPAGLLTVASGYLSGNAWFDIDKEKGYEWAMKGVARYESSHIYEYAWFNYLAGHCKAVYDADPDENDYRIGIFHLRKSASTGFLPAVAALKLLNEPRERTGVSDTSDIWASSTNQGASFEGRWADSESGDFMMKLTTKDGAGGWNIELATMASWRWELSSISSSENRITYNRTILNTTDPDHPFSGFRFSVRIDKLEDDGSRLRITVTPLTEPGEPDVKVFRRMR